MSAELLPPPTGTTPVRCPSCGHELSWHDGILGCRRPMGPMDEGCACTWTPNDVAWALLYGSLTPDVVRELDDNRNRTHLPW